VKVPVKQRRVAIVVCANGLGHFVRTLHIASELLSRAHAVTLTIVASEWQLQVLAEWPMLVRFRSDARVSIVCASLYPRWSTAKTYFDDPSILDWHAALAALHLDAYDLVLSDNLVETLRYSPRTLLVGSFLWHDVYSTHRPDSTVMQEYRRRCASLLEERGASMIASKYFAMPAVVRETRCVGVGILPSVLNRRPRRKKAPPTVLVTGSPYSPVVDATASLLEDCCRHLAECGLEVLIEKRLASIVRVPSAARVFDYHLDDFAEIGAIVGRPGMGTITDCMATATPLFCLPESNPEMAHNTERLETLGLGWRLPVDDGQMRTVSSVLTDASARQRFRRQMARIDLDGLETAVSTILRYLE